MSPIPDAARACLLVLPLLLAGCSSDSDVSWSQLYDAGKMALTSGGSSVTLEQAAAIPYATMGVRLGDGNQQLIVLASNTPGGLIWTSSARIAITTDNGRILRTAGFAHNLDATVIEGDDALPYFRDPRAAPRDVIRDIDLWDMKEFSAPLRCQLVSAGSDDVEVLGKRIATHRVDENCRSDTLDWSFTDRFWMDDRGTVWKSVQYIHPQMDPLELEIFRPPA